jgi:hypothetical protein
MSSFDVLLFQAVAALYRAANGSSRRLPVVALC